MNNPMNDAIRTALDRGGLIDLTTTGSATGYPRRIEIVLHNIGGRLVISGMPIPGRTRAWIRNVEREPRITIHLKQGVHADLPARARVITEPAERRTLLEVVARTWRRTDVDAMVEHSPLIEITIPGYSPAA
jgi:hypothetical protein